VIIISKLIFNLNRKKALFFVMNPNKVITCEYLIKYHEKRGDKILIFSDNLFALKFYSQKMKKPYIYGNTPQKERLSILNQFKNDLNCLFISKIGDTSIVKY
jgi:DNA excision repair protein ERCC-3